MIKHDSFDYLALLACPLCKHDIRFDDILSKFQCNKCNISFNIIDGIPVMLKDNNKE